MCQGKGTGLLGPTLSWFKAPLSDFLSPGQINQNCGFEESGIKVTEIKAWVLG